MHQYWNGSSVMSSVCRIVLLLSVAMLMAVAKEPPPKELVTYIQEARRLGVADDQIRRNAANAGWASGLVDDTFAAIATTAPANAQAPATANVVGVPEDYRIGPGDVLQVAVWKEPEASVPAVAVRADGRISLPLVKEVEVAGMTPAEAEQTLAAKLRRYIHAADVTVIVTQVNSRKVYMVGGIRNVGAIDLRGALTVLQAITQAGGLTDYAKRKQIYVLRTENGRQVKIPFNYEAVVRGEKMEQNILLAPNDTVVVPQ
jgi:polysaccharide biosynthesis/export protein